MFYFLVNERPRGTQTTPLIRLQLIDFFSTLVHGENEIHGVFHVVYYNLVNTSL